MITVTFALTTGRDLHEAYQQWTQSRQAFHLAEADRLLTHALSQLRFERGGAVSGAALEPAKPDANLADLAQRRKLADETLSGSLGILAAAATREDHVREDHVPGRGVGGCGPPR